MAITRAQQARQMLKNGTKPVVQGGVDNYLGKQPQVVAPRKWQSGPDKPPTELAYITEAEKKLLLKEDIHGSLKKGPNQGPAGIISLDSFGDIGGAGAGGADTAAGGGYDTGPGGGGFTGRGPTETKSDFENRVRNQKEIFQAAERRQARDLGIRERKNVIDMRRPGKFGFNPLATVLGFINPVLGLATRGIMSIPDIGRKFKSSDTLADFFSKVRGPKDISTDDDDTTLLDQVDPNLPFAQSYLNQLKSKMTPKITIDDDMSLVPDKGLMTAPGDSLDTPFQKDIKQDNFLENAMADVSAADINRLLGTTYGATGQQKYAPNTDIDTIRTIEGPFLNPSITDQEIKDVLNRRITEPTGVFAADGGMIGGGIMDLESARQELFLGGVADAIGKGLKKVTRSVKKIAKSPIGKAALIGSGLGLAGIGPLKGLASTRFGTALSGFFGKGSFNPLLRKVGGDFAQSKFGSIISGIPGGAVTAGIVGTSALAGLLTPKQEEEAQQLADDTGFSIEEARQSILNAGTSKDFRARGFRAEGGPAEGKEPVAKKTMPLLDMGGQEMDLRAEGGFVPIGRMEKADDVPARLSKNEFVFTADAVRNAGDGDVDKGAEVMYNMMKNLESGGDVSEESQGLEGARKMFQTSQRLEEVL